MIDIEPGQRTFFSTYEEAKEHKEWLKGMKDKFIENKERIKKIAAVYKNDGRWM